MVETQSQKKKKKTEFYPKIFMITIVHTRYYPTTSGISQVYPKILL